MRIGPPSVKNACAAASETPSSVAKNSMFWTVKSVVVSAPGLVLALAELLVRLLREEALRRRRHRLDRRRVLVVVAGLAPPVAGVRGERLVDRLGIGPGRLDHPRGLGAARTEVHGRVEALREEAERPQRRQDDHPAEERDRQDQVPHAPAEHRREHEQDAPDEQHERHDHGEPALDQGLAPDLEPEAARRRSSDWTLVVGFGLSARLPFRNSSTAGVDGLRVHAHVVLERDLLLVLDADEVVHDVVDLLVVRARPRTGCSTRASARGPARSSCRCPSARRSAGDR